MENEAQSRILNIPEILARIWKRKVVFLLSFLLVLAVGCGWVFTKPEEQTAKQLLVFKFPETTAESQATPSLISVSLSVTDPDPAKAEALLRDVSASLAENAPKAFAQSPEYLRIGLDPLPQVTVGPARSGRGVQLVVVVLVSVIVGVGTATLLPRRS